MVKVGYFQFAPVFGEKEENLNTVLSALNDVNADLIVLPELPFTGYGFSSREELLSLAEDPSEASTVFKLVKLCRTQGFRLVTGFAEKAGEKCYNSALLLGPAGIEGRYRKLHLFDREKTYFDPGDLPLDVFDMDGISVGMMVCFDWIFPEVARTLALRGADILCHPANLVLSYCQQTMLSRCTENLVYAVTANRTGSECHSSGTLDFTGASQIAAPGGRIIHRSGKEIQEVFVVEVDILQSRNKCITERNDVLADRRPEFYY
ncbi:MAG: acyltransferase [Candidatus Aegiribacteria sp.]|nr:acyltransferase [Candidatus Aegiribacteria sp.]